MGTDTNDYDDLQVDEGAGEAKRLSNSLVANLLMRGIKSEVIRRLSWKDLYSVYLDIKTLNKEDYNDVY